MPTDFFAQVDVCIGYTPIGDEPVYGNFLKQNGIEKAGMSVLADRGTDPQSFAESLTQRYAGKKVCIFIPGREFDAAGTRHGRGGGWYDRFLSAVPREWLRVGVLNASQFSPALLKREPWDEPMDVLLVTDSSVWRVIQISK